MALLAPQLEFEVLLEEATLFAMEAGLCPPGKEVVVVHGCNTADAEDGLPMVEIQVAAGGVPSRQTSEAISETVTPKPSLPQPKAKRTGPSPFAPAVPPSPATTAFQHAFYLGGAGIHHVTSGVTPFGSLAALAPSEAPPSPKQQPHATNRLVADVVEEGASSGASAAAALRDNLPAIPAAAKPASNVASLTPSPAPTALPKALTAAVMAAKTLSLRTTAISLVDILDHSLPAGRKTKIVCTLGPSCWSEEGLNGIINAGMDVARFNFSHGTHQAHQEVLDRLRKVGRAAQQPAAVTLWPGCASPQSRQQLDYEVGPYVVVSEIGSYIVVCYTVCALRRWRRPAPSESPTCWTPRAPRCAPPCCARARTSSWTPTRRSRWWRWETTTTSGRATRTRRRARPRSASATPSCASE